MHLMPTESANLIRSFQSPALGGVEVFHAAYHNFAHPRHFHDTYVIGAIEKGGGSCWLGGSWHRVERGMVIVIAPGDVHTGEKAGEGLEIYRAFYPARRFLEDFHQDLSARPLTSGFREAPQLAALLIGVHRAFERGEDLSLAELRLGSLMSRLQRDDEPPQTGELPRGLGRAIEAIHDEKAGSTGLRQLAEIAGLSPFHFIGQFRKATGMTPHQYVLSLRIARARRMLLKGLPAGQVATEVGFADQSHLTRAFRKFVGSTPAAFARTA